MGRYPIHLCEDDVRHKIEAVIHFIKEAGLMTEQQFCDKVNQLGKDANFDITGEEGPDYEPPWGPDGQNQPDPYLPVDADSKRKYDSSVEDDQDDD